MVRMFRAIYDGLADQRTWSASARAQEETSASHLCGCVQQDGMAWCVAIAETGRRHRRARPARQPVKESYMGHLICGTDCSARLYPAAFTVCQCGTQSSWLYPNTHVLRILHPRNRRSQMRCGRTRPRSLASGRCSRFWLCPARRVPCDMQHALDPLLHSGALRLYMLYICTSVRPQNLCRRCRYMSNQHGI